MKKPKKSASQTLRKKKAAGQKTFELMLRSDPKEIRKMEDFLQSVNEVARLDDGTMYRLLVAGTEAVNNAILHANKSDPAKHAYVCCILKDKRFVLKVRDEGSGFDPSSVPNPIEEKNLLKTSGRGIFLMRSLMDDVKFKVTKKGTEVELVINLKLLN
ncbi:MAG: ATP-binding protein [bacterium]